MNNDKKDIVATLKKLKEYYGAIAIKAEFEAEGSRKDELIMLRELVYQADMGFIIKIGGCEAVHDLDQCKLLDATGIMAPMIETPYAMLKFKGAANKVYKNQVESIDWIINAETKTCLENFDDILKISDGFLTGVTVGRSDLSASMGIIREEIESDRVYLATYELVKKARGKGLIANFGGNIGIESIPFIIRLSGIVSRFETRKVVLSIENKDNKDLKMTIHTALEFEYEYLSFKHNYYNSMAMEDAARLNRLQKQLSI